MRAPLTRRISVGRDSIAQLDLSIFDKISSFVSRAMPHRWQIRRDPVFNQMLDFSAQLAWGITSNAAVCRVKGIAHSGAGSVNTGRALYQAIHRKPASELGAQTRKFITQAHFIAPAAPAFVTETLGVYDDDFDTPAGGGGGAGVRALRSERPAAWQPHAVPPAFICNFCGVSVSTLGRRYMPSASVPDWIEAMYASFDFKTARLPSTPWRISNASLAQRKAVPRASSA